MDADNTVHWKPETTEGKEDKETDAVGLTFPILSVLSNKIAHGILFFFRQYFTGLTVQSK